MTPNPKVDIPGEDILQNVPHVYKVCPIKSVTSKVELHHFLTKAKNIYILNDEICSKFMIVKGLPN